MGDPDDAPSRDDSPSRDRAPSARAVDGSPPAAAGARRLTLLALAAPLDVAAQRPGDHRAIRCGRSRTPATPPIDARPQSPGSPTCPSTSPGGSARSCARRCSSGRRSAACCRCCGCAAGRSSGAAAGVLAVLVFAVFAAVGPADQHALRVPRGGDPVHLLRRRRVRLDAPGRRRRPRRRWWMAGGALVLVALLAYAPSQYRSAHRELDKLARQQSIEGDLLALVRTTSINLRCGPVGVPNHAPIPLLALYLKTSPENIVSAQVGRSPPASTSTRRARRSKRTTCSIRTTRTCRSSVPPGFTEASANRSWLIFQRCVP